MKSHSIQNTQFPKLILLCRNILQTKCTDDDGDQIENPNYLKLLSVHDFLFIIKINMLISINENREFVVFD